jgi:uncharacterized protein
MRSIRVKAWLALALLAASPLASAAGFDCGRAATAVERRICGDAGLSRLDSQMTEAFVRARAKAGPQADALSRDQRHWLAERDDAVGMATRLEDMKLAAGSYRERIAFLDHLFDAPPADAPLLAAIVKHLASQPLGRTGVDEGQVLGGDGAVFKVAAERPFDPAKPLPFDAGPLVKLAGDVDAGSSSGSTLLLLDDLRLGGLYSVQGTAECVYMKLFGWHGRVARPIPVPETLSQNCWTLRGWLVEFRNRAYALQSDESSVAASDIEAQRWDGDHWGRTARVLVRYDYRTSPQYVHCALADCAALTALARDALDRHVRSRDAGAWAGHLPAAARAQFETLRQRAGKDAGLQALPWADVPKSYASHGDDYAGFRSFDDSGVFFPLRWQGEWLVGRVGHAALGWRTSDDWLLGVWRWDGHAFVPVLGMVAPTRRTGFLLAAWLPPKPFVSR